MGGGSFMSDLDAACFIETIRQLERRIAEARAVVEAQAEDYGLWFRATTAPEAYLQQELRRLHRVIEEEEDGR